MSLRPIESEAEASEARDGTRRRLRRWPARRPFMGMLLLPTWDSHGARNTIEVFAVDGAGNRSAPASVTVDTR